MAKALDRKDWDFSELVGETPIGRKGRKGRKERANVAPIQTAALKWELSREFGLGPRAWLDLPEDERTHHISLLNLLSAPVLEISVTDFSRFINNFSMVPRGENEEILREADDQPHPNPIGRGDAPHILAIRWNDYGIEEIISALQKWVRKASKEPGRAKPRSSDPMSDLWSLAAFRLHRANRNYEDVAKSLNSLPKFKVKRPSYDAESARKASAEGKKLVERAKPSRTWTDYLMSHTNSKWNRGLTARRSISIGWLADKTDRKD